MAGDQRRTWYRAFGDLALTRLPAIGVLGLAPTILHALLGIIQPWVQVPGRSLRRFGASAPSFPLVVASVVLCARRPADSGPLLDSLAGWHYHAGDHGRLQPWYAVGLQCSSCGRLRAAGVSEASAPPLGAPRQGLFCIHLDCATPVTVEMASRAVVELGGMAQPGAVPVGRLQGTRCEPPPPEPGPPEEYASYALRVPHDPLEHLQRSPPDVGQLLVVAANCGGLGSDPGKVPRLIAYLACAEPDIAHLQEAGTQFAAACMAGLPYRVCVWPLIPGGGWSPWCTPA